MATETVVHIPNGISAAAKSLQSYTDSLWPHRRQPTRLPIPGILQARTLQWVAISFSNAWKWKVKVKSLSRVRLLATPWTAAYQAPPSTGFSRQEYWSGVPLPSPNGRSLSYKKERIWVSPNEVDEPRAYCSEISQKDKDKYHILMHLYGI